MEKYKGMLRIYTGDGAKEKPEWCDYEENYWMRATEVEAEMARLKKNEDDTGGGCSVCSGTPSVNVEGTYWLCGSCMNDIIADMREME